MRKLTIHKTSTPNSLADWWSAKNPITVTWNFLMIWAAKYFPSMAVRRILLRMTGMRVGHNVGIGLAATFDIFFPELIELGDNCIIGYNATILAHEFVIGEWRTGKTRIGKNTLIGTNSTVLAGVDVGSNSSISAMSLVNADVPPNSVYGGIPAKPLRSGKRKY